MPQLYENILLQAVFEKSVNKTLIYYTN